MYPPTNKQDVPTENITISNKATTINTSTLTVGTKAVLDITIQSMFEIFDKVQKKLDNNDAKFEKQHEELINLIPEKFRLSEDTNVSKEENIKFPSKITEQDKKISSLTTYIE